MELSKEKIFGLWKESDRHLSYYKDGQFPKYSIFEYLNREKNEVLDAKVGNYLENGRLLAAERSAPRSILNPDTTILGDRSVYTDGTWVWFGNVKYYFKENGLSLPEKFLENIMANNFIPPIIDRDQSRNLLTEFLTFTKPL